MFKIAWKSFRYNIKSFIVFFLSAVFSVAMIFGFMYLGELTKEIKVAGLDSDAGYILGQTLVAVLVVSICIMLYSVKFYVRTRSRDYTMLLILGIRKKHFILFVALEYIFSWIVSIVIGLGAGNLVVLGFRKILEQIGGDAITYSVVDVQKIYTKVLGWCVVLIIGVVLVLIGYMAERDLSYLLQADIKKERPKVHKIWGLLALGGIVLVIIAVILSFFTLEGENSCMGMLVTSVVGVYFSLQFGLGIVFERYKERHEDKYYRNALKWNSFYCRLTDNINIVAAQVMIGMAFIYFVWTVSGGIAQTYPEKYPYDLVCKTSASEGGEAEEICKKYGKDVKSYPCVENYFYSVELLGISESTCKEIWGKSFDLNDDEMAYFWGGRLSGIRAGMSKIKKVEICLGWQKRIVFEYDLYKIKEEEYKYDIFGEYITDVLVYSDAEFERLYNQNEASCSILLMNGEQKAITKAEKDLRTWAKGKRAVIQGKESTLRAQRLEGIVKFSIVMFGAVSILIFLLFTLCIKIYSDIPFMREKYQFLNVMGMKKAEKRRMIKSEIATFLLWPSVITAILGFLQCVGFMRCGRACSEVPFKLFDVYSNPSAWWILPQIAVYLIVMILFTFIMSNLVVKWVEKEELK